MYKVTMGAPSTSIKEARPFQVEYQFANLWWQRLIDVYQQAYGL